MSLARCGICLLSSSATREGTVGLTVWRASVTLPGRQDHGAAPRWRSAPLPLALGVQVSPFTTRIIVEPSSSAAGRSLDASAWWTCWRESFGNLPSRLSWRNARSSSLLLTPRSAAIAAVELGPCQASMSVLSLAGEWLGWIEHVLCGWLPRFSRWGCGWLRWPRRLRLWRHHRFSSGSRVRPCCPGTMQRYRLGIIHSTCTGCR